MENKTKFKQAVWSSIPSGRKEFRLLLCLDLEKPLFEFVEDHLSR